MTVKQYNLTRHYEQVRVSPGEHPTILEAVCHEMTKIHEVTWRIEGDALVFEWAMGDQLTGGEDFFEEG